MWPYVAQSNSERGLSDQILMRPQSILGEFSKVVLLMLQSQQWTVTAVVRQYFYNYTYKHV